MISFLIPYRENGPERASSLDFVLRNVDHFFPGEEIILGDCQTHDGQFNRSMARNEAAKQAHGDVFVFLDADSYVYPWQLKEAINHVLTFGWVFPYTTYYELTEAASEYFKAHAAIGDFPDPFVHVFPSEEAPTASVGGCVLVTPEVFEAVNGYDERFIGWGEEDRAFALAVSTLFPTTMGAIEGPIYHLWHPAPEETRFGQPHFDANRKLCNYYRQAEGDQHLMRNLVGK